MASVLYVSASKGSDTGNGGANSPFLTIDKAVANVVDTETTIMLDEGDYLTQRYLADLSKSGKVITIEGKGLKTTLIVNNCGLTTFSGEVNFRKMIIKPSDGGKSDGRAISYTSDDYVVNFYNCLFKKSDNNMYPSNNYFYTNTSGSTQQNKSFYNCSFHDSLNVCQSGTVNLYNSALTKESYSGCELPTDCVLSAIFDTDYQLINNDNSLYGVYSGSYKWIKVKIMIYKDGKYYSIKQENYNTTTKTYNSFNSFSDDNTFELDELFTSVTIDSETFKPIDKFDSFQLVSSQQTTFVLKGRKSDTELVVGSSSFNSKMASNIDYFKVTANTDNNAHIKMAVSIDEGLTWKTTSDSGVTWTDLSCTIPLKEYADLTSDEKIQWNTARDEINNNGFNVTDIETIDFNTLKADTIIFAYVLYQDTYDSICDNLSLEWQFDSKGTMVKMGTDECKIALTEDKVIVTPTSNQSMMKINILNGLVDMGGGSANFESATSTDIQNILSKGW